MFTMKLADHSFTVYNQYPYLEDFCRDYRTAPDPKALPIRVSPQDLAAENLDGGSWPLPYLESLAVYRKICESLVKENIILFHSSALALDGQAVLFLGPSGTGKSTHARLWRQRFGEQLVTVNDDKPLLSFRDSEIRVWGTPYGGKDNLQTNTSAPVRALVVLAQAPENRIRPLSPGQALPKLLTQAYHPSAPEDVIRTLDLVKALCQKPVFQLSCTISQEAVRLCYESVFERNLPL